MYMNICVYVCMYVYIYNLLCRQSFFWKIVLYIYICLLVSKGNKKVGDFLYYIEY